MGSPFDNEKKTFLSSHSPEFSLRKVFVATLIFGTVFVILGSYSGFYSIGFMGPIGLMVLYIALGRYINRGKTVTEQFADSCYYLGFLFTLVALTISLFSIKEEYNSSTLIWNFALALFTTIIGLGYKVYLSNFHDTAEDSQKRAEGELTEAINAYIDTIETARTSVDIYINELNNTGKKVVDSTIDNINKSSEVLLKFNNDLVENLGKTIVRSNVVLYDNIKTTYNMLNEGVEELLSSLDNTCEKLNNKVNTIKFPDDIFISELSEPIKNLEKSLSTINNNFEKEIAVQEKLLVSSTALTEKFDIISIRSEETSKGLNSLITQINKAANINIDSGSINNQLSDLANNLDGLNKKILPLSKLDNDFESINQVLGSYKDIVDSINKRLAEITETGAGFVSLNENIGTAKTQLETFNDQINKLKIILSDLGHD